jgi:glutathione S-transferase
MASAIPGARFKLYYWPIPFRGCFVSYLFAYRDVPLITADSAEEIEQMMHQVVGKQVIPFMGPPVLRDLESGRTLSQVPAIVMFVAGELGLCPGDRYDEALCLKVVMDCNDVLMEICRYNGSIMWDRDAWLQFRSRRFPRWLHIFEENLQRGFVGKDPATFADIAVFALFGNMIRCLPELEADVLTHAPGIHALCRSIGAQASLSDYVARQQHQYGDLYCGGQIEQSIRKMLALDSEH